MREWLNYHGFKVYTVITKMDYVSKAQTLKVLKNMEKTLQCDVIPFSTQMPINKQIDNIFEELI